MENKKAAPPLLEETAIQDQSNWSHFLSIIQGLLTGLRALPSFPFIVSGVAWLVMIVVCWGMMP